MNLAPGEEQVLAEIESRLRWSDPRLTARLALFGHNASRREGPARERLSPWRSQRRRTIRMTPLAVAVVLALLGMALADPGRPPFHGGAVLTCGRMWPAAGLSHAAGHRIAVRST